MTPPLPGTASLTLPGVLPVLPVRNLVLFPGVATWVRVGRQSSRRLLEETLPRSRLIAVFTQKYDGADRTAAADLCRVGTAGEVRQLQRDPDGLIEILVRPFERVRIQRVIRAQPFLRAEVAALTGQAAMQRDPQWEATLAELRHAAEQIARQQPASQAATLLGRLDGIRGAGALADFVAAGLELEVPAKQDLLEERDEARRVRAVLLHAADQLEIGRLQRKIRGDVEARFAAGRRQSYLQEQLRAIRDELGEGRGEGELLAADLRRRLNAMNLPAEAQERMERELRRLVTLRPGQADYLLAAEYLEFAAGLPWAPPAEDEMDLVELRRVLDERHYDLDQAKQRLIEHVAVRRRNPHGDFPILCLLGPPGMGKQSLARSLATALGRPFAALALSGIQAEAEILGSRRTRPEALPGRPLRELRRLGARNPVLLLGGVDQFPVATQGDPAEALLELVDPRRNGAFTDRYLDLPFDCSRVLLVATAHYADDIPAALRDRLEIVRLPGYSDADKRLIATRHLWPRQLAEHGLPPDEVRFAPETLDLLLSDYTREAGVRALDRQLGVLCRALVGQQAAGGPAATLAVTPALVGATFGPPRYLREERLVSAAPGVVTGLAWTSVGGEIMHIEVLRYPGKGQILLTGQIGSVMKESAQAALSLLKSRADGLALNVDDLLDSDVHVHVPAGAVPKDGPSAGAAIFVAMVSLWTGRAVRPDVAMTGELTLRGLILPVGGLREKILAAQRAGIPTVVLPKQNAPDLVEVPASVRDAMDLRLADSVDDVVTAALVAAPPASAAAPRRKPRAAKTT